MQTNLLQKLRSYASTPRGQVVLVILTLAVSLLIRLLLFRYQGYDEGAFEYWYNTAAEKGLYSFYDITLSDHPPFNAYTYWLFGKLAHAIGPSSLDFFVKLPANLFDLATAYLIFRFVHQRYSFLFALGAMAVYALNPATIFDSAVWGQTDSIHTFFMVASLFALMRSRYELSSGMFASAILTKPQSVVLLPVLAYLFIRKAGWKRILSSVGVFVSLVFVLIIPFHWDNPLTFLVDRYTTGYDLFQYNSLNAYNFWALLGFWKPDTVPHWGLSYQTWGIIAFLIFAAFVMWQFHRKPVGRAPIFAVFLLMFGFFMLMTRMHERYLFPVFALLAMAWATRLTPWLYLGLTGTYLANLVYVMSKLNAGAFIPDGHWSIYVLAPINIVLFGLAIWDFWRLQRGKAGEAKKQPREPPTVPATKAREGPQLPADFPAPQEIAESPALPPRKGLTRWGAPLAVALLTVIFFSVAVWNLGDLRAPRSDFVPQADPEEVHLDLGNTTRVDKVFVLVKDASAVDMDVYWGSPANWSFATNLKENGVWHKWRELGLGQDTRYVRLVFKGASGRIGEVALFQRDQKLPIEGSYGEDGQPAGSALTDEQEKVHNPASPKSGTYFDEIYFVRTAEEHLKLQEPSQWDHPPVSKLIIAASIAVFGHDPFAWRFAGVIFATLMIPLIYLLARRLFNSQRAGVIAAFLLTFDFMHFAEARIATPETFILFFVMLMFYFFLRYCQEPGRRGHYLFLALVCFGLGFSTKWIVMYGFVGLIVLLLLFKWRKPIHKGEVFWFVGGVVAAVAVYMLSYIPYFLVGHGLADWWDMEWRMFSFHSSLEATHPYGSAWYTWPLMLTPVYLAVGRLHDTTSYIVTFGNPALWWAGILAVIPAIWLAIRYRNQTAAFIVVPFLAQWLPFAPISRVLFIYHFYPNVLFMILALTLWAEWLWRRYEWGKWAVAGYLVLNVACFAAFFPIISGLPMPDGYWNAVRWMVNWAT